ncbi:hypothetical protein [Geodermatophilus sp. URMC 63]
MSQQPLSVSQQPCPWRWSAPGRPAAAPPPGTAQVDTVLGECLRAVVQSDGAAVAIPTH